MQEISKRVNLYISATGYARSKGFVLATAWQLGQNYTQRGGFSEVAIQGMTPTFPIFSILTNELRVCGRQRQTLSPTSLENSTRATLSMTLGRSVALRSTHLDTQLPSTAPCSLLHLA